MSEEEKYLLTRSQLVALLARRTGTHEREDAGYLDQWLRARAITPQPQPQPDPLAAAAEAAARAGYANAQEDADGFGSTFPDRWPDWADDSAQGYYREHIRPRWMAAYKAEVRRLLAAQRAQEGAE